MYLKNWLRKINRLLLVTKRFLGFIMVDRFAVYFWTVFDNYGGNEDWISNNIYLWIGLAYRNISRLFDWMEVKFGGS